MSDRGVIIDQLTHVIPAAQESETSQMAVIKRPVRVICLCLNLIYMSIAKATEQDLQNLLSYCKTNDIVGVRELLLQTYGLDVNSLGETVS